MTPALQALLDEIDSEIDALCDWYGTEETRDLLRRCKGQMERDAKDAERYRWLRSPAVEAGKLYEVVHDDAQPGYWAIMSGADLDAAIDAAMQSQEKKP